MPLPLKRPTDRVSPQTCKICHSNMAFFGNVDFEKNCEDLALPTTNQTIPYYLCMECGFICTYFFDNWEKTDFIKNIYNEDYTIVDPDFSEKRPEKSRDLLISLFGKHLETIDILDYGGGNGQLADKMNSAGGRVTSYDHFYFDKKPCNKFDVITLFEVMEHVTDPSNLVNSVNSFLNDVGVVVLSTLLQPNDIASEGVSWWYLSPRNGHFSLYTSEALKRLWLPLGFGLLSVNDCLHLAVRGRPHFLSPFIFEALVY